MAPTPISSRSTTAFRTFRHLAGIGLLLLLGTFTAPHLHATNMIMQHNDFARDGANLTETNLSPATVNVTHFGKIFTRNVDGLVYAQPLYVNNVTIATKTQDVVFVVTEHNSVYAFDADNAASNAPLWHVNLGPSVPQADVNNCSDLVPEVGISGTPTIDLNTGTLYVDAKTKETNGSVVYFHRLHALDITTGQEKFGGPVVVTATVNTITFNALHEHQRAGLLLLSNIVYIGFGSHCDWKPYNGWLFGYNATNLSQVFAFNTTPDNVNSEGAIWSGGMAPAVDTNANIYLMTGNGAFNATNGTDYSQCFLKCSTTNGFAVADWFSPFNEAVLSSNDRDVGTGGAVLLPGTHMLMGIGKNGTNYLLNQNHLGGISSNGISDTNILQEFLITTPVDRIGQSPAVWIGPSTEYIYVSAGNNNTLAYSFNGSTIQTSPLATSAAKQGSSPGGISISANSNSNGVVWVIYNIGGGLICAYNATNINSVLWSSTNNAGRDSFSGFVKFVSPIIVDGKVFVPTTNAVVVYGAIAAPPASGSNLVWTAGSGVDLNWSTALNWNNPASGGGGPPTATNYLVFDNTAAVSSTSAPNNIANSSTAVAAMLYNNNAANTSPNYNITRVNDGQTVIVTNGLTVGTQADSGATTVVNAIITGANGTLVLTNGILGVTQGSGTDGAHQAVLDLSGLGNLLVTNLSRLAIAVDGQPAQSGNGAQRCSGIIYLAKTNRIMVTSTGVTNGILIGWNDSQGNGNTSGVPNGSDATSSLFLGETNAIFTDAIYTGTDKTLGCLLAFNPTGLNNPVAVFRNKDGVSRVSLWGIGDTSMKTSSNQSASGTNDFSGGTVDIKVNTVTVGISETGNSGSNTGNGSGTLTLNSGTIDANNLTNGASVGNGTVAGSDIGSGVINVNGTATLKVNGNLALAQSSGGGLGVPVGTLNVNGGSCFANTILAGSGASTITLNNGTLAITNRAGSPTAEIGTVATTNSTIHLNIDGNAITTNIVVNTLAAGGVTTLSLDSVSNITTTTSFPLVSYSTFNGSIANFTLGSVPANLAGTLTNDTVNKQIDLIVTHAPATPVIANISLANTNLILSGTGGAPTWTFYLLASSNLSQPLSNWSAVQTGFFDGLGNFQVTNGTDPTVLQQFYILQMP